MHKFAVVALLLAGLAGCTDAGDEAVGPGAGVLGLACPDPCERTLDDGSMWSFEPDAAVDPVDPQHMVVVSSDFERQDDLESRWVYVHESRDGGTTWARERFISAPPGETDHPLALCTSLFDPLAAFLPDGTLVLAGVAKGGRTLLGQSPVSQPIPRDAFVAVRAGGGWVLSFIVGQGLHAWEADRGCVPQQNPQYPDCAGEAGCPFVDGTAFGDADKPFLAVGHDGRMVLSVRPAFLLESLDGGLTWRRLPDAALEGAADSYPYSIDVALMANGVLCATSTTGGLEAVFVGCWEGERLQLRGFDAGGVPYPRLEAGPDGRLWLAYARIEGAESAGASVQTPVLRYSDDLGETWSDPLPLDDADQPGWIVPTLAVDGNGVAYSGFYHHLADGTNEYRITASDGVQVARVRVDASPIGHQALGLELGHYMGLAGLPDGALATWVSGEPGAGDLRAAVVHASWD